MTGSATFAGSADTAAQARDRLDAAAEAARTADAAQRERCHCHGPTGSDRR